MIGLIFLVNSTHISVTREELCVHGIISLSDPCTDMSCSKDDDDDDELPARTCPI